jgi:hypothetical protein
MCMLPRLWVWVCWRNCDTGARTLDVSLVRAQDQKSERSFFIFQMASRFEDGLHTRSDDLDGGIMCV